MSNIYIQEPPSNGKVLLKTTVGDIDIELWSKEAPKASRNFVQLCLEGYYNGTIFHRVIRDFIAQGGDPTGTGTGGESIYGKPFKDEFHSRLRFVRRGLVCMANAGPHDNGSQFFFTFGPAPNLQSKHTIFGKVTGDTVYNMMNLQECETDPDDRPLYPHKINKTQVLHNPFDDIVPRVTKVKHKKDKDKKESQSKATKNFKLLSFGEEAEEDEEEVTKATEGMKTKGKSSHDLLKDKQLSSRPAVHVDYPSKRPHLEVQEDSDEEEEEDKEAVKESIRKKLKKEHTVDKSSKPSTVEEEAKSSRAEDHKKQEKSTKGKPQHDPKKRESDSEDSERRSPERNRSRSSEKQHKDTRDSKETKMQVSPEQTRERERSSDRNQESKHKKSVQKDKSDNNKRKSDKSKSRTPEPGQKRGNDSRALSKERLSPEKKRSPAPSKSVDDSKEKSRNEGSEKKNKKSYKEKEKVNSDENEKTAKLEELQKEARQLRKELAMMKEREKKAQKQEEEEEETTEAAEPAAEAAQEPIVDNDPVSEFKAERKKYKEARRMQPKKGSGREEATLAILAQFKSRLETAKEMFGEAEEGEVMDEDNDEEGHVKQDPSTFRWLSHKLRFEEHDKKVLDANIEELSRYEIFDPRNPMNKRRREASKAAMKTKR